VKHIAGCTENSCSVRDFGFAIGKFGSSSDACLEFITSKASEPTLLQSTLLARTLVRAPCTHFCHKRCALDGEWVNVRDSGQPIAETTAIVGTIGKKDADDPRAHRCAVARRHHSALSPAKDYANTSPNGRKSNTPGQTQEPAEKSSAKVPRARIRVRRVTAEALRDQCRLLGIIGNEPRSSEQPKPVNSTEPPQNGLAAQSLGCDSESVAQCGTQESAY